MTMALQGECVYLIEVLLQSGICYIKRWPLDGENPWFDRCIVALVCSELSSCTTYNIPIVLGRHNSLHEVDAKEWSKPRFGFVASQTDVDGSAKNDNDGCVKELTGCAACSHCCIDYGLLWTPPTAVQRSTEHGADKV